MIVALQSGNFGPGDIIGRLDGGRIADIGNRRGDVLDIRLRRIKLHDRPPAGEVYTAHFHAGHPGGGLFHMAHATGAVHPGD